MLISKYEKLDYSLSSFIQTINPSKITIYRSKFRYVLFKQEWIKIRLSVCY
jgi:hypothetical protein